MSILHPAFCLLAACGCWRPISWSSITQRLVYNTYTAFIFLVIHVHAFTQLMDIILNVKTADEFTDNFYILLASLSSCCKIITLLLNRRNIRRLTSILERKPYRPADKEEEKIRTDFDNHIGTSIIQYTILVEVTVVCMVLSSFLTNYRHKKLAYRAWLPYDTTSTTLFTLSYLYQMLGLIAASVLNVGCDSIICGLLMHTCSQIDILQHRLARITPETSNDLGICVRYHIDIYRFAYLINEKFRIIIGIQFIISTLVVCFNLYELANSPLSSKYLAFVLYMACMMTQIFIYCWYGNRLKLKVLGRTTILKDEVITMGFGMTRVYSQEQSIEITQAVYEMDWMSLDNKAKRSLVMIMRRARKPIEFTSTGVIAMDLSTFVAILKMSYSTYNLLQTSNDTQ